MSDVCNDVPVERLSDAVDITMYETFREQRHLKSPRSINVR